MSSPLPKKAPKIQEEDSSALSPPAAAAARMTASGPEAEKISATRPLPISSGVMSRAMSRKLGGRWIGFSIALKR